MIVGDLGVVLASKSLPRGMVRGSERKPTQKTKNVSKWSTLWDHGHAIRPCCFSALFSDTLWVYEKELKWSSPGGVDMQSESDHACACFVRIGIVRGSRRKNPKKDQSAGKVSPLRLRSGSPFGVPFMICVSCVCFLNYFYVLFMCVVFLFGSMKRSEQIGRAHV